MGTLEHTEIERWVAQRDGEAFRRIVETYGGMVYASARRILGSAEDAAEVTQECFAVLAGVHAPPRAPLGPWLHRVATNRALNRRKADQARQAREAQTTPPQPCDSPPAWREIEALLDEAIAGLPAQFQVLVIGHYLLGKSHRELAEAHVLSRQTVTHRLAQALDLLQRALRKRGVTSTASILTACLAAHAGVALPQHVLLATGKHAVAAACGITQGATLSTTPWSLLIMSMKLKITIATAGLTLLALAWQTGLLTLAASPSEAIQTAAPALAPVSRQSLPEAPLLAERTAPAPQGASPRAVTTPISATLPVQGIWQIESHIWENPTVGGGADETFAPEEVPEAALRIEEDRLRVQVLEPWNQNAVFGGAYEGHLSGRDASLRAVNTSPPFLLQGSFNENLTRFSAEGRYTGEAAADPALASQHLTLVLRRVDAGRDAVVMAATAQLERRRQAAQHIAAALRDYARDHPGQLPASLDLLVPHYLNDAASLEAIAQFAAAYTGGSIPAGLLHEGTPWAQFEPALPMAERLTAWEAYQQERWGGESPLLPPVLRMEYHQPAQALYIDALGRVSERDYISNAQGGVPLDEAQQRQRSMNNLQQLGLGLFVFQEGHDQHLPAGWLSLQPDQLDRVDRLTHPADPPGTLSYRILLPAQSLAELAEGNAQASGNAPAPLHAIPVAAERHAHGVEAPGYNVAFADGTTRHLDMESFDALCAHFGITPS